MRRILSLRTISTGLREPAVRPVLIVLTFLIAAAGSVWAQSGEISEAAFVEQVNETMYTQPSHGLEAVSTKLEPAIKKDGEVIDASEQLGESHVSFYWKAGKPPQVRMKGLDALSEKQRETADRVLGMVRQIVSDFGPYSLLSLPLTERRVERVEKRDAQYYVRAKVPGKLEEWTLVYDESFRLLGFKQPARDELAKTSLTQYEGRFLVEQIDVPLGAVHIGYEDVSVGGGDTVRLGTTFTVESEYSEKDTFVRMADIETNTSLADRRFTQGSEHRRLVAREIETRTTPDGVSGIAFSKDGSRLTYAAGERVRLLDAENGFEKLASASGDGDVVAFAAGPDGRFIASVAGRNSVSILDSRNGLEEVATFEPEDSGVVEAIAFSPEGRYLALGRAGGDGGRLTVLDAQQGYAERASKSFGGPVLSVSFSPDGAYLAAGAENGAGRIFDVAADFEEAHSYQHEVGVDTMDISPDAQYLASGARVGGQTAGMKLVELGSFEEVFSTSHKYEVAHAGFSPEGNYFAYQSFAVTIRILRVGNELSEVHTLEHAKPVLSLAFSPDGRYLTAGGRNGTVFFIDTANDFAQVDRYVHVGNTINNEVTELAYSPDGRYLVSGTRFGEKNQLKIMRIEGGE